MALTSTHMADFSLFLGHVLVKMCSLLHEQTSDTQARLHQRCQRFCQSDLLIEGWHHPNISLRNLICNFCG